MELHLFFLLQIFRPEILHYGYEYDTNNSNNAQIKILIHCTVFNKKKELL